jgi:fructosamine-3-kinase
VSLPPGATVLAAVGGGDINQALRVELRGGEQAFVKTRDDAKPGEYAAEAAGLRWLAEPGALRTPRVIDLGERHLALQWIEQGRLNSAGEQELGRGLAETHDAGAATFGDPGTGATSSFGSLSLPNEPAGDWPTFYAERRLLPLSDIARRRGAISAAACAAVERVAAALPALVGPPEPPARLHGDLWSGNVMADTGGRPWLIDPSAYGGHREVDLAMLRLFGGTGERVFAAYDERHPLSEGWQDRVELYQLLPLLVHAVLFGGSYAESAHRAARRYAG